MADYKPDHQGMAALAQSPGMRGLVDSAAQEGAQFARTIAPDAPPFGEGYVDAFEVHTEIREVAGTRRWTADLVNTSDYAAAVEFGWFGTPDRPGYHVLSQTADVIGD